MRKQITKYITGTCFGFATLLTINPAVFGEPVVPGFDVTKYAEIQAPGAFAFSPDGMLYVVPIQSFTNIYRIGPGGSPVEQIGDTALGDSFFRGIAFDASGAIGAIGGVAGSVLVGDGSNLLAVLPDQTTAWSMPPVL